MDRRFFLECLGVGAVALGGFSSLTSCQGLKRDDLPREQEPKKTLKGLDQEEMGILELASLAPSGHNTQPWTLKVLEPRRWVLGSDPKRWLPAVDPENREMLLALGAFLENLVLAAGTAGYRVDVDVLAKGSKDTNIAELRLLKDKPIEFPLEKIRGRRTVRSGYLEGEIKKADLDFISKHSPAACTLLPSGSPPSVPHSFYFPNGSREGKFLQEATIEANRKQAFRDPAQEELASWIRWSNRDAKTHRNGLTPESMEITGFAGLFVRWFYDRQSVLKKDFREQTVDVVAKQARTCGGWIVVTSPDSSIPTLLQNGMVFEEMLLKLRERMMGIHPMTQLLEEEPYGKQVAKELGLSGEVQWVLRVGYLKAYPDPVSLRMPVPWFVQT